MSDDHKSEQPPQKLALSPTNIALRTADLDQKQEWEESSAL